MTALVIDELRDTALIQEFTIKEESRVRLKAVRLNLYIHNSPPGDLTLEIKKDGSLVVSKDLPISSMLSEAEIVEDFVHGYFLFSFIDTIALGKGAHTLELTGNNGYNFNESAYVGWIKGHDPERVNTLNGKPASITENPFDYQLWKYRR